MNLLDLRPVGETEVLMEWEDGHRAIYTFRYLRYCCPCAGCVDENTGKRTIKLENVPETVKFQDVQPVGRYALRFHWSDAHLTGIYSFDYLRFICPCDACAAVKKNEVKK